MLKSIEHRVMRLFQELGIQRVPLREAKRRFREAVEAIEAAGVGGTIIPHDSDEAADVQAPHRLA